jgi:hypothetical protein
VHAQLSLPKTSSTNVRRELLARIRNEGLQTAEAFKSFPVKDLEIDEPQNPYERAILSRSHWPIEGNHAEPDEPFS